MFNRLTSFLSMRFGRTPEADPFEGYVDVAPVDPAILIPPPMAFHVTMPGKFRPYALADCETEAAAICALVEITANFAAAGWFVYRQHDHLWRLSKETPAGHLITRLEILSSEAIASQQGQST